MTSSPSTKVCSLAFELEQLEHAAEAATVLTNLVRDNRAANHDEATKIPVLSGAVVSLLGSRLRDLRRVVRGQRDPAEFWSPACDTAPTMEAGDDADVRFPAWSDGERRSQTVRRRRVPSTRNHEGRVSPKRRPETGRFWNRSTKTPTTSSRP